MLPVYDRSGNLTGFVRDPQLIAMRCTVVMMTNGAELELGQTLRVVEVPSEKNLQVLTLEVVS